MINLLLHREFDMLKFFYLTLECYFSATPMLKSILSNKLHSQEYIFPEYRSQPPINHQQIDSITDVTVDVEYVPHHGQLRDLGSGEHKASLEKVDRKKRVHFGNSLEEKSECNGKHGKPAVATKKKKGKVKNGASGDGCIKYSAVENGFKATLRSFLTTKWAARFEYLAELEESCLKNIQEKDDKLTSVHFCDSQPHLNLGSGPDFSATFLGQTSDGTDVAVKKVNIKRLGDLVDESRWKLLTSLNSPHLVKVYFITRDKTHFYIVKELCEHSLAYKAKMRRYIPAESRSPWSSDLCYQIARSLAVLHTCGLAHKSLKPDNIFLHSSGVVKLADYQVHERCLAKKAQYSNGASSLSWLPSEILGHAPKLTMASDIASLGIIFYWLITDGGHPFGDPGNALDACLRNIKSGRYNLKPLSDPFAHHLVQHMIYKEPEKRISISQVLEHPYFWTEDDKVHYVQLLAKAYCTLPETERNNADRNLCNEADLKQVLKNKEQAIYKSSSSAAAVMELPSSAHGCLKSLCKLVLDSMHENDEIVAKKVLKAYPGLIIELYTCFSSQDLEEIVKEAEKQLSLNMKFERCNLQTCLSADSGICSPSAEVITNVENHFELSDYTSFLFDEGFGRNRGDSECYASTDDGIDIMSPVCGSLKDSIPLSAPIEINYEDCKEKLNKRYHNALSPKENCSSVDTNFEFDVADFFEESSASKMGSFGIVIAWTDMDELD